MTHAIICNISVRCLIVQHGGTQVVQEALVRYREEVEAREFPSAAFSPYKIKQQHREDLARQAREAGFEAAAAELERIGEEGQQA